MRSAALGFFVGAGSAMEAEPEAGLSHLLEHMLFRGTAKLQSHEIDELFDGMGAELNAGTDRESTVVYSRVLDVHLEEAFEVVADMVWRPALRDLETEREVVLEEIAMYEDDPQDQIFDVLGSAVFGEHALGRPVIGTRPVVSTVSADALSAFHAARYRPSQIVVAAAGSIDHERIVELAQRFGPGKGPAPEVAPRVQRPQPEFEPRVVFRRKDTEQIHVCLGGRGLARDDERRFALRVADSVLGGTSSSRLFQEVREKRGLAYSVSSFASFYEGAGQIGLYLGTRADNLAEALRVVGDELERFAHDPASEPELRRAKENFKGRLVLALESTSARMHRIGAALLADLPLMAVDEVLERVEAVSLDDVRGLAAELFSPGQLSAAGIGPDEAAFRDALAPLAMAA